MTQAPPIVEISLPDVETFFAEKPTIKPLQHSSDALRVFVQQFEYQSLNPQGAELLAELSQLLENEAWCQSHDAAHEAIQAALTLIEEEAYAAEKSTIESLSKSQMVQPSTLKMVKDEALVEALKPLQTHLEQHAPSNMKWMKFTPSRLKPKEGEQAATLAEAVAELKTKPLMTEAVKEAALGEAGHVHGPHCNHAPKASTSGILSRLTEGAESAPHTPSSDHSCGPTCNHDHAPPATSTSSSYSGGYSSYSSSSSSHTCGPGCGHDHGPSSSGSSYSGGYSSSYDYGNHTTPSAETAAPEGNLLERAEQWMRRQKPANVIAATTASAGAVGLLYLSGKAEQRRQRLRQQNASSEIAL